VTVAPSGWDRASAIEIGAAVGVGVRLGVAVGVAAGLGVGVRVGVGLGEEVGLAVGSTEGVAEGSTDGSIVGLAVGVGVADGGAEPVGDGVALGPGTTGEPLFCGSGTDCTMKSSRLSSVSWVEPAELAGQPLHAASRRGSRTPRGALRPTPTTPNNCLTE